MVVSPTGVTPSTPQPAADDPLAMLIGEVVALSNQARQRDGCRVALTNNPLLNLAAQRHSEDMAQRGYFDHISPEGFNPGDRITSTGYQWQSYGENIAAGYTSAAQVVEGWMRSPGHRANILNCDFREIGVGYTRHQASNGQTETFWTQVFATVQE